MTQSDSLNNNHKPDTVSQIFEILSGSFRFRFFLFILLIYIAGATLSITNTNPGSRFMLTKEIAENGDFAIREDVREFYSYLDFSVINQVKNPGFEEGENENQSSAWITSELNSTRTTNFSYSGNFSHKLQPNAWIEQRFSRIDVDKIYENYTLIFWGNRGAGQNTLLNISFHFTDSTVSTYWINVVSSYFRKYSIQFSEEDRDKSFSSIRITNGNTTTIYLDDFELYYSYSDKPPGVSLLAVPIYWAGDFVATQLFGMKKLDVYVCTTCEYEYDEEKEGIKFMDLPDDWLCPDCGASKEDFERSRVGWHRIDDFIKFLTMICVLIFGSFIVLKMYDFMCFEGISQTNSHRIALLFGLGSLFYVYIGTFFSHSITAGLILLALYQGSIFRKKRTYRSLLWTSILSGYMVVCDYIFLFFLPFFYLYLFIPITWNRSEIKNHWKDYFKYYLISNVIFLIPMIICGFLVTYYNYLCFGDPFNSPYTFARFFQDVQHFAAPMMDGLEILLLSTHHGLLTFMPIILISILGLIPTFRKNPALAVVCLTAPLMLIFLYSKYYLPTGGLAYGPRQLVPIVPFLLIPLAFLLDLKLQENPFSSIIPSFNYVFLFFLKICAGILGILTFIINFAGGWVGVYPLGGQDMTNPIWGTADQKGHIDTMFGWINFSLDFNGNFSLDLLQGHYLGEVHLDLVFVSFSLNIHWPAASSLALHEISAFAVVLFLILLINPYFPLTRLVPYIRQKIHPYFTQDTQRYFLRLVQIFGIFIFGLFLFWTIEGILSTFGVPIQSKVIDNWNKLIKIDDTIGRFPLINLIGDIIFFILFFIMNLFLLRPSYLSIERWLFNSFLYLIGTAILSIADENEFLSDLKAGKDGNRRSRKYFFTNRLLTILYISESLITMPFFISGSSIYSEFLIIILLVCLTIIVNSTLFLVMEDPMKNIDKSMESAVDHLSEGEKNILISTFEDMFVIGLTSISSIITGLLILSQIGTFGVPLTDFIFLRPFTDLLSIRKWFFQGVNSVPIYLSLFLLLQITILVLYLYTYSSIKDPSFQSLPIFSQEERDRIADNEKAVSGFQSVLLFGGWLVIFFYLLITILYSALSSVPDPSSLLTYSEEHDLFFLILLSYIFSLFYTGMIGMKEQLSEYLDRIINRKTIRKQE